ncbi:putative ankyrin repeat domain containing protein [Phaeomoniella chlamydospora]|uniref:Putative ankyrin repeat domain containing protein n=1 Tax=Phaeomoniella chlamydospora TaxID=158046 RepID=A0A0G2GZA2_PHACM|nr:putative ankyrin repeat domain containing protein [Phaeomoniella chlamydospora]
MESPLPVDVIQELSTKIKNTINNFTSLDLLLTKLLIYERKKGFTKLTKGFNLMFVDSEILTLTDAIAKDRDALRMVSLAFKWVLGDANADTSMGNAYTSLAKALRVGDKPKSPVDGSLQQHTAGPRASPPQSRALQNMPGSPQRQGFHGGHEAQVDASLVQQYTRPSATAGFNFLSGPIEKTPITSITSHRADDSLNVPLYQTQNSLANLRISPSPRLEKLSADSTLQTLAHFSNSSSRPATLSDTSSQIHQESLIQFEDMIRSSEVDRASNPSVSMSRGSKIPPRWDSAHIAEAGSPAWKTALVSAVQQRDRKLVEELLDSGVSPEAVTEVNLLTQAILNADPATVRLLLLFGANPNRLDSDSSTPLLVATDMSAIEVVKLLLKYGGDPNLCAGPEEETPLATAVRTGKIDLAQTYLQHRGDTNMIMPKGDSVFIKAINKTAPIQLIDCLLTFGADPNGKTKEGKTPLFEAITIQRVDIVTLLLDKGAKPNLAGPKHPLWPSTYNASVLKVLIARGALCKMTPGIMELATSLNNIDSISILLKAGVDPNIKKDGVYTPLCSAIRDDRQDIVTLLLNNGADPNIPASEYPAFKCITHDRLHFLPQLVAAGVDLNEPTGIIETAVAHGNKDAVLYLLREAVDVNARNATGSTPLTTAIVNNSEELVDLLLEHGANPTIRGQDWPLCMAVKRPAILERLLSVVSDPSRSAKGLIELAVQANQLESIKHLIKAGFNVEDKTGGVFSPLTTAIREERKDIVRYLLDEAGANINSPGEHLPIIKAIRRSRGGHDTEVIEMLLERGADVNLVYRGWNAVMQAVETGDPTILRLLIDKSEDGVDLQVTDHESGKAVIDFVRERGWPEGAAMLLKGSK